MTENCEVNMTPPDRASVSPEDAALRLASFGWPVFLVYPVCDGVCYCDKAGLCSSPGKHPITARGFKDATTNLSQISAWWSTYPDANLGLRTGADSGFWVLDADGEEGLAAVHDLEREHGPLPRTPTVRTGGGGRHFFFRWPEGQPVKNAVKLSGLPIDVRGEGGYVVAPPSMHRSGLRYLWEVSPDEVKPAEAPSWLLDLVRTKRAPAQPCVWEVALRGGNDLHSAPGVAEGERHNRALELIGSHLGRGEDPVEVERLALGWARRCEPPMPEDEVQQIVMDLADKEEVRAQSMDVWEPPMEFQRFDTPPFPTSVLPDWLRDFVEAEAVATQTPPDLAGMLVLATLAACGAKKVQVRINVGYVEQVNLFALIALPPANRKSAVFNDVMQPLVEFECAEKARLGPQIAAAENSLKISQARLAQLQKDAADAEPDQMEARVDEAARLQQEIARMVVPKPPRCIADDVTAEALGTLLAENKGRLALASAEGDVFELIKGRYSKGQANFGIYNRAHAGDDLWVDRKGRPSEFVKKPALTMALAVQPDVIRGLMENPSLRQRGLLARFLYALPASNVGSRDVKPPPMSSFVLATYRRKIASLVSLPPQLDDSGDIKPRELLLSPKAEEQRLRFAAWLEPRLGQGGDLYSIADWAGKLLGAVLRIAGLLHLAEHAGQCAAGTPEISHNTMEHAVEIGFYLIDHARAAFDLMGADPMVYDAQYVLGWIKRKQLASFSQRDAFEGTKGHFRKVDALRPALALLVTHGHIRLAPVSRQTGPGRRPSTQFEVNPFVHSPDWDDSQIPTEGLNCANSAHNASQGIELCSVVSVSGGVGEQFEGGVL
jgi:hypothetical protein